MEVRKLIGAFVDGEVDEDFAAKIAEHLEDCRRCGLNGEIYARIKQTLQAHPPAVDDDAVERLREFGSGLG